MKVKVVENLCIGCGACTCLVPDCFELSDEGIAVAKKQFVESDLENDVKTAADNCPTSAISIDEE